jgi:nucleoside-diphosphate-sugar epimerase
MHHTVLVTGSSGYIGSAVCVALARRYRVVGLDKRPPSPSLCRAAPAVQWHVADICDKKALHNVFKQNIQLKQPIDFVLHFAAFYHYGSDWRKEYDAINIQGTRNIMAAACYWGVWRVIFASSIGSLKPPPDGCDLLESHSETVDFPYNRSKAIGEAIVAASNHRTAAVVLRIGGVFSDWCELPPLYTLMKLWSRRGVFGRCMPGIGRTGFPYIHRKEMVKFISRIIERDAYLEEIETLFCAEQGCTCHKDLYPIIRQHSRHGRSASPIHIPTRLARFVVGGKYLWNHMRRKQTYERVWMLEYVDKPLRINAAKSQSKLKWSPNPDYTIINRLPVLMHHFNNDRALWEMRNIRRNEARYKFHPDVDNH